MGNYLFFFNSSFYFNFNLLNYRIYVQKRASWRCSFGQTQALCLRSRSANLLIRLQEFIAFFCQERHLVKHRGGYFSDVVPVLRRALCGRVQDRWVLAAAWKVAPRFNAPKIPTAMGTQFFRRSLMNAVIFLLYRFCHVAPMTVLVAVEQRRQNHQIRWEGNQQVWVSCVDMELHMSGDPIWVGLVECFTSDQFTTHSCSELTIRGLD